MTHLHLQCVEVGDRTSNLLGGMQSLPFNKIRPNGRFLGGPRPCFCHSKYVRCLGTKSTFALLLLAPNGPSTKYCVLILSSILLVNSHPKYSGMPTHQGSLNDISKKNFTILGFMTCNHPCAVSEFDFGWRPPCLYPKTVNLHKNRWNLRACSPKRHD